MARPLRIEYPGAVYHVTCRGNEQREIFTDDADRRKFIELLEDSAEMYSVKGVCLCTDVQPFSSSDRNAPGQSGEFMRRYNISYTGYFNRRHKRVGHLYREVQRHTGGTGLLSGDRLTLYTPQSCEDGRVERRALKEQSGYLADINGAVSPDYISGRNKKRLTDCTAVLGAYGGDIERPASSTGSGYNERFITSADY